MHEPAQAVLRRIRLNFRRRVDTHFVGQYRSAFKGNGLLFDSVREYIDGDDVRTLDWNVSARMQNLYVREYAEERELNIVLMIDVSASMEFGSTRMKADVLHEVAAFLLLLAQTNNDRISVLLFSDQIEWYFTPRKGRRFVLRVLNRIMEIEPRGKKTDIAGAVEFLDRVLKKRSVVFVLSDFLDNDYLLRLRLLRRRHDVIPVLIEDPLERESRFAGLTQFTDLETGEVVFAESIPLRIEGGELRGMDPLRLSTAAPVEESILAYFEKRNRRMRSRW